MGSKRSNFDIWYNDIADMPTKDPITNVWYDAETGLSYSHNVEYSGGVKSKISAKALEGRAFAKIFGGVALRGTAKQKTWAERIRFEKLKDMTEEQAVLVCEPNGLLKNSKFWIENRDKDGRDIAAFIEKQKQLLSAYQAECNIEERKQISAEYNALTTKWGFE